MIDMNNIDEIKQMADHVKDSMTKLINLTDKALENLPIEERKQVMPVQKDIHTILDAVKKGDTMKIHEISKKYAGSDNQ